MDEERRLPSMRSREESIAPKPSKSGEGGMDEEAPELKKTGADFYLKMLEKMQAAEDPMLGQGFQGVAEEEQAVDLSSLTLGQKMAHKSAKVKMAGLEQLGETFEQISEQTIKEELYAGILESVASPLPTLQKAALDMLLRIVEKKNTGRWVDCKELMKQLTDKVLVAPKPAIKKPLVDLVAAVHKKLGKDAFFEACKDNFSTKVAKARAGLLKLFSDLLGMFGIKEFPALKYWDQFIKDAENTNPAVKKEFVSYSVDIYRWIGDGFSAKLASLKKSVSDEITRLYEDKKNSNEGKQLLPSLEEYQAAYMRASEESGGKPKSTQGNDQDAYDLFDPVDIYKNYGEKWTEKVLAQEKWIEKKTLLDEFITVAEKNPKHTGSYSHLIQLAKRLLDDPNMAVQVCAVKMLTAMCKGLRKEMARDGKRVIGLLLPRLKERKKLAEESIECLKQTAYFISPQDCGEEIESLLQQKNNPLKLNILEWLNWFASREDKSKLASLVSAFKNSLGKLIEDGALEVRDSNLMLLKTLSERLGKENCGDLGKLIDKLPKTQLDKLTCMNENTTRSAISQSGPSPRNSYSRSSTMPLASKKMDAENTQTSSLGFSKPPIKGSNTQPGDKGGSGGFAEVRLDINTDAAIGTLSNKGITIEEWRASDKLQWKAKIEYFNKLCSAVGAQGSQAELEALAVLFVASLKNFKEANPNLLKEFLILLEGLFTNSQDSLSPKFIYSFAWFLVEKYGDPKFIEKENKIMDVLSSKNKQWLMLSLCEVISSKNPAPKVHSQLLTLLGELVKKEHKLAPKKELLACAKEACASSNAAVREEGGNLVCTLYQYFGEMVRKTVCELNPQIKKNLESKLDKIQPMASEPDENQPRKDVSQQLAKIIPQLSDSKWLTRKDALVEVGKIMKMAGKISLKGLSDFGGILKQRLVDSNQTVSREALSVLRPYIKALGVEFKGQSRTLMPLVIPFLIDKTEGVRDTAKEVLDLCQGAIGSDWLLTHLVSCLADANSELVLKVIDYLCSEQTLPKIKRCDLKIYCKNMVLNIIHKNSLVRTATEKLLDKTQSIVSKENWAEVLRDLNPTTRVAAESALHRLIPAEFVSKEKADSGQKTKRMDEEYVHQIPINLEKVTAKPKLASSQEPASPSRSLHSLTAHSQHVEESCTSPPLTYAEPKDEEISALKASLVRAFGESVAEKMLSNEQSKLMESLSNIGLIKLTNLPRYLKLLSLILSWMYVRVYDTTRKPLLDLFAEFLQTVVEDCQNISFLTDVSLHVKIAHVFLKIMDHHPNKDDCLGLIRKFTMKICRTGLKEPIFTVLLELLPKREMDQQVICVLLTELVSHVDLRKCLSLATLYNLENYTNSLSDLTKNEIYHFYNRALEILGHKFLQVFNFKDKSVLTKFFNIRNPSEPIPSQTALAIILRQAKSGDRDEKLRAMEALASLLQDPVDSVLDELAACAGPISDLIPALFAHILLSPEDQDYLTAASTSTRSLFVCPRFLSSVSQGSLYSLLDRLIDLMVSAHLKSMAGEERFKEVIRVLNQCTLLAINGIPPKTGFPVLIELMTAVQSQQLQSQGVESLKLKAGVAVNAFLTLTKKLHSAKDADGIGLEGIFSSIGKYLSEFEGSSETEKSGSQKAINTFLNKICEILGERVWQYYREDQAKGKSLSNMLKVILLKETLYPRDPLFDKIMATPVESLREMLHSVPTPSPHEIAVLKEKVGVADPQKVAVLAQLWD